jgi:hypothetical protein
MLYIKVNEEKELLEYCKNCNFEKKDENNKSRIIIESSYNKQDINYGMHLNKFTKFDPTIPRVNNINCKNKECTKKDDEDNTIMIIKYDNINLKYIYYCVYCSYFWTNN